MLWPGWEASAGKRQPNNLRGRALARSSLLRDWFPCAGAVLSLAQTLGLGLGLELVQPPGDCLRHAKGAPDGDPRDG